MRERRVPVKKRPHNRELLYSAIDGATNRITWQQVAAAARPSPPGACCCASNLFGDWTVMRKWGRRGSPGTVRLSSYQRRNEAETAEQRTIKRRLQHGYTAM
jgi:hypothetical protein